MNRLMLFREMIDVCCQKHIQCGEKNGDLLAVAVGGT